MIAKVYIPLADPMFDLGFEGYLNSGGSEGLFLRVPAIGPEESFGPFGVLMRRQFDAMATKASRG